MYNGIGLQTARGSGTNGYVQTNKFFVRPRTCGKPVNGEKGFEDDQGTAGLSKKPNKDILEHDRKRQIHLKLSILEDKLTDQGYSDAEISQKIEEARVNLEAAAASDESDVSGDLKISDTQTHQVAARKEKQLEAFRAALGLPDQQQTEEGMIDDEPTGEAYEGGVDRLKERREHSFLDRDSGRKLDLDVDEKDGKGKESKKQRGDGDMDEVKGRKIKESKKRRRDDDSSESDEHGRDRRRHSKKKTKRRKQDSDTESDSSRSDSYSDSDSDSDTGGKRRRKPSKRHDFDVSEHESMSKKDETEYENKKQLRSKVEVYSGGMKQISDEEEAVSKHGKDRYRNDSDSKKVSRDSDDSEAEYENRRQLKDERFQRGRKLKREEDEDYNSHGRDMYRSEDAGKRRETIKEDDGDNHKMYDRYRSQANQEGGNDKGDNDRDRYRQ